MKKKTQKILGLFLLLTIVFSSLGMAYPKEYYAFEQETGISPKVQAQMDLQQHALDAYEVLYENLQPKTRSAQVSSYNVVYDEDYGGEYIDGDRLVLLLVGRNKEMEEKYSDLCGNSSYIRFADAQYSLNELNGLKPLADELMLEYGIVSHGVDVRNNRYHIGVIEDDYNILLADKRIADNLDRLSITSERIQTSASLYGGDKITNSSGTSYSVCIGGTYKGKKAFVTAGHGNSVGGSMKRSGLQLGVVKYQRANENPAQTGVSSFGDFAIVEVNGSTYTPTNKVMGETGAGLNVTGVYSSVPVGTTVYKYGSATKYSWGNVTATMVTVRPSINQDRNYRFNNMTQCSMKNKSGTHAVNKGDSGGCVYIKSGSTYKIQGSVSCFNSTSSVYSTMYSSPIYYAMDVGFSPYTK